MDKTLLFRNDSIHTVRGSELEQYHFCNPKLNYEVCIVYM